MTLRRPRQIPGSTLRPGEPDYASWNGHCPVCEAEVLWAMNRLDGSDSAIWHAPLDPVVVEPWSLESDLVYTMVSSTGEVSAITPKQHRRHVCPPDAVRELLKQVGAMGYYTAEILAVPCPVRPCGAAPGMLCLTSRREALYKPHGARAVESRGEELEDPNF